MTWDVTRGQGRHRTNDITAGSEPKGWGRIVRARVRMCRVEGGGAILEIMRDSGDEGRSSR